MTLFLALFFTFISGCLIAGVSLHDPDTCWQLALGKLIFDSGNIIRTDPFSYTFTPATAGHDFVMYQWLSNLIFYVVYKTAGLFGLLCLTAQILSLTFITLPLLCAREKEIPASSAYLVVILGSMAASFHFLARPEIWSYLFLLIYLHIALKMSKQEKSSISWPMVISVFVIMLIWCNLHSGFVLGVALLAILAICALFDRRLNSTILIALAASVIASFCNPYGLQLWTYLPHLFFPSFNRFIVELKPLGLADFNTLTFFPYVLISIISIINISQALSKQGVKSTGSFPLVSTVLVIVAGVTCRRFIPFSVIVQTVLIMHFLSQANQHVTKKSTINSFGLGLMMAVCVALGVYWTSTRDAIKLEIPQSSIVFQPPMKAIEYLRSTLPTGNMLNDPQFGDVMILHMNPVPKLFIDTRFDMYGSQLVNDYHQIIERADNFEEKLDSYNIDWVFLRPQEKLVTYLKQKPNWKTVYEDDRSTILVKQNN